MTPESIEIATHDGRPLDLDEGLLAEILAGVLVEAKAEGTVSCILADDQTLLALNRDYRGKDQPTDVLTFELGDGSDTFPSDAVLGEIYISRDRAGAQARDAGRPIQEEIAHLAVHGALHLSGHEHDTDPGHAKMVAAENKHLARWRERAGAGESNPTRSPAGNHPTEGE